MRIGSAVWMLIVGALLVSGCSVFPGLRVLTGQQDVTEASRSVESLDMVMADKSGGTDPLLLLIGDRIEAANPYVDVIEVRSDPATHIFTLSMIYVPPQTANTAQGAREQNDLIRRTVEIAWQAALAENDDADTFRVMFLFPNEIATLDNGPSFIGVMGPNFQIERSDAAAYLSGQPSLQAFGGLLADGTLIYNQPEAVELYAGSPNHPMFVLPSAETGS
jgi:hypothetical protein